MPVKKKKRGAVRKRRKVKAKRKVHGPAKRKRIKRKPAKRKAVTHKRKRSKPKRKRSKRAKSTLVIQQTSVRTRRTIGKKKRKRTRRKTAKRKPTRRRVGRKGGSTGLLVGLAVGLGGLYLLSQSSKPTTPYPSTQYPPLQQSSNSIRNSQTSEVVSYAIAAGYAVDAITKLINLFNNSSDEQVDQIYQDAYQSGGDLGNWV